jgi:hypothetical protein
MARGAEREHGVHRGHASLNATMASPQTQTTPQRLAAIREQMSLLSDYL